MVNGDVNKKRDDWDFEFKTNGDKLKIDTKEMLLAISLHLEMVTNYTLEKYTDNCIRSKNLRFNI